MALARVVTEASATTGGDNMHMAVAACLSICLFRGFLFATPGSLLRMLSGLAVVPGVISSRVLLLWLLIAASQLNR